MIFSNNPEKKPLTILLTVMLILNIIVSINLSLANDLLFFLLFAMVGIAVSSLILTLSNPLLVLSSFFIGALISVIIEPSALTVIRSLTPLPFAFAINEVLKSKLVRSVAISISSAIVTVSFCVYFAFYTYNLQGAVTPNAIIDSFPAFFDELTEIICSSTTITVAGETVPSISPEGAEKYLVALIGVIPGVMFFIFSIIGYLGAWLYKKGVKLTTGLNVAIQSWKLSVAFPTAVTFILALIVSSLSSSVSAFSLAAANICVVLYPTLFMAGLNSAFEPKIVGGYKFPRLLRPAVLIIVLLYDVTLFFLICAFYALFDSIKGVIKKRKSDK